MLIGFPFGAQVVEEAHFAEGEGDVGACRGTGVGGEGQAKGCDIPIEGTALANAGGKRAVAAQGFGGNGEGDSEDGCGAGRIGGHRGESCGGAEVVRLGAQHACEAGFRKRRVPGRACEKAEAIVQIGVTGRGTQGGAQAQQFVVEGVGSMGSGRCTGAEGPDGEIFAKAALAERVGEAGSEMHARLGAEKAVGQCGASLDGSQRGRQGRAAGISDVETGLGDEKGVGGGAGSAEGRGGERVSACGEVGTALSHTMSDELHQARAAVGESGLGFGIMAGHEMQLSGGEEIANAMGARGEGGGAIGGAGEIAGGGGGRDCRKTARTPVVPCAAPWKIIVREGGPSQHVQNEIHGGPSRGGISTAG